jgi:hypothetical protein
VDKVGRILGVIIAIGLLLTSSILFIPPLATAADDGEGEPEESALLKAGGIETQADPMEEFKPEEDTNGDPGRLSFRQAHITLEDLSEIRSAQPASEEVNLPAKVRVPLTTGWQTIMTEDFEETWPRDLWSIYVGDADAYWGKDDYNPYTGSYSAFCAKEGTEGVDPPGYYPLNMDSWMDYGPFSLADATDAELNFHYWLESDVDYDWFWYLASTDGYNFYGDGWSGSSNGWAADSLDLTDVYGLGNLCGQSQVWITFVFQSDDYQNDEGVFVDDVVLQKYTSAQFDLAADEVYLSTTPGDVNKEYVVDTPSVGQEVYLHFKWDCLGSGTTPQFHIDLNLDGEPFCSVDRTANGGTSYTTWCDSPWTATSGAHTLTGVLDVNSDVSESNETNNQANKYWGGEAAWTFMVYLDGDNDLEDVYMINFNLMELAANNADVNIIVQFDRFSGDWTTTRRYKVKYDTNMVNFASYTEGTDYWDLGELNMADPATLSAFVVWAEADYPADHYCLALVNHGGGWKPTGVGQTLPTGIVPTGIVWDDTSGDYMSTADLDNALSSAISGGAVKLDVLFLDACLMQMVEVGYEVKDYSQYLVASEYYGWAPGPYDDYISSITSTTTAHDLATTIVNEYHNGLTGLMYAHTMSAVDLSQYVTAPSLASAVDDFAQALTTGLSSYRAEIESSRSACQKFDIDSYIDLYDFASLIYGSIADTTIQTAAQAVMDAVSNTVIAEAHDNGFSTEEYPLDNAHGISIYFPASEDDSHYSDYNNDNLGFVADEGWDEFLAAFYSVSEATVDISVVLQGAARPDEGWVVPITIKFFSPGANVMTDTPIEQFDLTTTKSGSTATCQCAVPPGSYDITAVSEHTIVNVKTNVAISAPSTAVDMGTLVEGNANDDIQINITDFSILASSFGTTSVDPGYDARADFDRNGFINISDFSLLAMNFTKMSPIDISG